MTKDDRTAVLTDQRLTASIRLGAGELKTETPILQVEVTELSNPGLVPLGIAVSISNGRKTAAMGNFAFFPADHKGAFSLDCSAALAQFSSDAGLTLVYELRKLRPAAAWKPVRVVTAAPRWRSGKEER